MDKIWEIKIDEDRLNNNNTKINQKIEEINNKVYNEYKNILKKNNYYTENKNEFEESIENIFSILCNIYDLIPNCEIYFQDEWIEMHLKLFNICLNFQDLPKLHLNFQEHPLEYFLTLFCICMSKDNDYLQRIKIFKKYPDFFYKVLIISMYNTHVCCCGVPLNFKNNLTCSCFKTGQIIFETFKNIEEQNLSLNIKEIKMKCVNFMIKNLGKNIAGVYLLKMENISNNKNEIFNYIIKETNLLKERLQIKEDTFGHCIDVFEKFISSCNNPELIYDILILITTPKDRYEIRLYRFLLNILTNIINKDNDTEELEKYIYNKEIFGNLLDTLSYDIWLGEYEGIWEVL